MRGRVLSRRRYLTATAASVVALAGCSESSDDGSDDEADDGDDQSDDIHSGYETTEVTVRAAEGEELGSVTAAIADTGELRYTGLSDTESLPEDRGMLFVYEEEQESLTYVMREMGFPIDIVYADSEGVITSIHHAEAPGPDENGNDFRYPGRGQYVLEVVSGWTTDRGVDAGDRLVFELP